MEIILDERQHKTESLFNESFKLLQGKKISINVKNF